MRQLGGLPGAVGEAEADWDALAGKCLKAARGGEVLVREGFGKAAAVWPTSQVICAAINRAVVHSGSASADSSFEDLVRLDGGLRRYAQNAHYAESRHGGIGSRSVYYDDNAWIALNLLTTSLLQLQDVLTGDARANVGRARGVLQLLQSGQDSRDGGVLWRVDGDTRNACSTAPAGLVSLRIVETERLLGTSPASDHYELIAFAQRCAAFITELQDSRGLIADHIRADGQIEPSVYSYNQGTAIGLNLHLHRITGDESFLRRAMEIAQVSVDYYSNEDRLWRECPAFVAIYLRHLASLRAQSGSDVGAPMAAAWLTRLSTDARNPNTGFYTEGGIGSYDGSVSLDQAGIVAARFAPLVPTDIVPSLC